jgi:tetratricopeptide (TPR) repeat protein
MTPAGRRISFQLIDRASKETLFSYLWEERTQGGAPSPVPQRLTEAIYSILSKNDWSELLQSNSDPGWRNEFARQKITAGREVVHSKTEDCDNAMDLFRKAVALAPDSALAHAFLSMEATIRVHYNPDRQYLEIGKTEAEIALKLSPASPEALQAIAGVDYQEGRFSDALEHALQSVERGGLRDRIAMFVGTTLDALGRPHQALGWNKLASQLAANPGEADAAMGDCWSRLVDDEQAERSYQRATELRPNSFEGTIGIAHLRLLEGKFDAAREIYRSLPAGRDECSDIAAQIEFFDRKFDVAMELYRTLNKANPYGGGSFYGAVTYCSAGGRAKQALGETSEARRVLEECLVRERANAEREPGNPEPAYRLAAVEASLGMADASLSHLRKAVALGWVDYRSLNVDPRFDSLRGPELETITNELSAKVADMRRQAITKLDTIK